MAEVKKKRVPFGGLKVCFKGRENVSLTHVFGSEEMSPGEMNRKLWVYLKFNGLVIKAPKKEKAPGDIVS